jgi:ribose/xylose/arabinose/galactoside ABC-type transport system permease subunit
MNQQRGLISYLSQYWAVAFLAVELLVFSITGAGFFSINGVQIVLFYGTSLFLLATAETFVIVTGGVDLSVGYVMGLATIVSAKLVAALSKGGMQAPAAILISIMLTLLIGLVPGLLSGFLVGRLKVPPFLATFSTGGIVYGSSLLLIGGVAAKDVPILANDIGNSYILYWAQGRGFSLFVSPVVTRGTRVIEIIPSMVVVTLLFIAAAAYVLKRTRFGQHAYAIGGNIDAAIRAGIDTKKHLPRVYMISSLFASLSGVIYMLEYVTGKADAGVSYLLDSIVAVVIGGASLYGGEGTIWGTILGCLILSVLETGLRMSGVQTFDKFIAVGVILIFAVLIDQFFPELIHKED